MKTRASRSFLLMPALAVMTVCTAPAAAEAFDGCTPSVVANDTSRATDACGPFLGSAPGQVFFAPDTLITEIVVWRPRGNQSSNPPGQLIPVPFVFNPPVVLPRPGYYAMFFQGVDCYDGEPWRLLVDEHNDYSFGIYWVTGRSQCHLAPPAGGGDNDDLIFEIHFCDRTTPVKRESWGQIKTLYR